ncbi:hypothetical protein FNV43_RR05327 [Rhamnella rubrinervis]|uniref:histidine kinase n=1 Tax=Rhamnella rubrinervis TaxID=2594499 RepID=A0A8K0MQZ8_9ROSA|nr:hypothetical protein FNV43_RR05327 [Rhamnella rubrinervis]
MEAIVPKLIWLIVMLRPRFLISMLLAIVVLVAPILFEALSITPHLTQISYVGLEGLFFSYYINNNRTFVVYSNSSSSNTWYTQFIDRDTGKSYGNVSKSSPLINVNESWFQQALNSRHGYASLGTKWNNAQQLLFLNTASFNGKGVVSLGFQVKALTDYLGHMDLNGGGLHLATTDGKVLLQGRLQNTHMVVAGISISFQLVKPNGEQIASTVGTVSCSSKLDATLRASLLNIQGNKYMVSCSPLDIFGVQLVYALAVPQDGIESIVHKYSKMALILLILTIIFIVVSVLSFGFIVVGVARREMHLCSSLIKQMEATRQAETKSMNKSLAIASASHDVRASLAGITGLIEISYHEVPPGSLVGTNLKQMDACIKDLLGILNSFLDTSKVEAGKMQLEEERFDVAQLVEDVVDLYHPVGMKKGIDVVLDPLDGSIMKFSQVKGDRGKLKQILCNLLSNGVKFTWEGHVTLRAWVRKPSLNNSIIASNWNAGLLRRLCCLFDKKSQAANEQHLDSLDDPNVMDFVFEVDDTGIGIPKEKQKAVFENYVQVKETALDQGGTGLGLGIVQSLVRLMHGEIGIVDKEIGEKGSCFRFNVLLSVCDRAKEDNSEIAVDSMDSMQQEDCGVTLETPSPKLTIHTSSPKLSIRSPSFGFGVLNPASPKVEGSHVVLLIQNDERLRVSQKFMESLGIKVSVVEQWERLPHTLKRIKHKYWSNSYQTCSGKSDSSCHSKSESGNSSFGAKDVPLSAMDGTHDYILSLFKKNHPPRGGSSGFILIVIDVGAGPLSELCKILSKFKSELQSDFYKVVWLANPLLHSTGFNHHKKDVLFDPDDIVKYKPFHGSCLYEVVKILPEFGGALISKRASAKVAEATSSSRYQPQTSRVKYEVEDHHVQGSEKPLAGKRILVVEDDHVSRKVATILISRLGATVELCENGKESVELVGNGLSSQTKQGGASMLLPYDYVLMDCEMPIMDGFEATRQIRKMEKSHGVHIPIIALTAHTTGGEETSMTIEAGMDIHLCKPFRSEQLLEAIRYIQNK